jgi:ribonuclease VapC
MVIDTSAVIAVLTDEPERRQFVEAIESAEVRFMSTASYVETAIVIEARHGAEGVRDLDRLIERAEVELMALDVRQAKLAAEAFRRYGNGRHPAGLNYGDCFSYALAMALDEPLLFKGNDFSQTDVGVVISP